MALNEPSHTPEDHNHELGMLPIEYIELVINDNYPSKTLQRPKTGKSKVIIKLSHYPGLAVPQTVKIHSHNLQEKFMDVKLRNTGLAEMYFKVTDGISSTPLQICSACRQREREVNLITCAEKGRTFLLKESNGQSRFVKIPVQFHCLPSCHGLTHFEVEVYVTSPVINISGKTTCFWGKHEVWTRFEWNKREQTFLNKQVKDAKNKGGDKKSLPPPEETKPPCITRTTVAPDVPITAPTLPETNGSQLSMLPTAPTVGCYPDLPPLMLQEPNIPSYNFTSLFGNQPGQGFPIEDAEFSKKRKFEDVQDCLFGDCDTFFQISELIADVGTNPSLERRGDMASLSALASEEENLEAMFHKVKDTLEDIRKLSKMAEGAKEFKKRRIDELIKHQESVLEDIQILKMKAPTKDIRIVSIQNVKPHVLIYYAFRSGYLDLGKDLWELYKDSFHINEKNATGHTLLHAVINNCNYDGVLYCLKRGADVNARNNKQQTALHLAYKIGDQDIIDLLESQENIDLNALDVFGYKPAAYKNNCLLRPNAEIAMTLRVQLPDYKDTFPFDFWYAARIGWLDGVKMYVETIGCPVDAKNKLGETPLMCACENERIEVAMYLLNHQAKITATNIFGSTPLHYAYGTGNDKLIQLLKDKGALPDVQNHWGRLPRHYYPDFTKVVVNKDKNIK